MDTVRFKVIPVSPYTDEVQDNARMIGCGAIKFGDSYIRYDCLKYNSKLYIFEWWPKPVIKEVFY